MAESESGVHSTAGPDREIEPGASARATAGTPAEVQAQAVVDGLRAMALLWQLRAMDNVWTNWAQLVSSDTGVEGGSEEVPTDQLAPLGIFVDGIDQTFKEFAEVSRRLEPMFAQNADVLRQQSASSLLEGLSEPARARVETVLNSNADLAEVTRAHLANMDATASSAVATIRTEAGRLAKGGTSTGDYDPTTEAVIGAVATGVGGWVGPLGIIVVEGFAHSETGESIVTAIGDAISDGVHAVLNFFFG